MLQIMLKFTGSRNIYLTQMSNQIFIFKRNLKKVNANLFICTLVFVSDYFLNKLNYDFKKVHEPSNRGLTSI